MAHNFPAGEVLFSRDSQSLHSDDAWDDQELINAYDKATNPIKAIVAARMGLSTEEVSGTESCSSSKLADDIQPIKSEKKKSKKKRQKSNKEREWAVGDHCQAIYSIDGLPYEATIIDIDYESETCSVQYLGYGNKERISLGDLKCSMGVAARRAQREEAQDEQVESLHSKPDTDEDKIMLNGIKSSPGLKSRISNNPHKTGSPHPPHFPPSTGILNDMIAPPPPPHVMASLPTGESEAMSAMLMAWYMSGFHTGYYQGLKRAKHELLSQSQVGKK